VQNENGSVMKIVVEPFSVFDVLEVFMNGVKWQRQFLLGLKFFEYCIMSC